MIKLVDFLGLVSCVKNIYIRHAGEKFSIILARFMIDTPKWKSYKVRYIQPDGNDLIIEVEK